MATESRTRWVTATSPTIEAVVNPFVAACEQGTVPDELVLLCNPSIEAASDRARGLCESVADVHGRDSLEVETTALDDDRDYASIVDFYRSAIGDADPDTTVAVNVTPGRKFMSAIAFQAGMQYEADHVYYFYLDSSEFYDRVYPDVPRTGADLVDFAEVFG